MWKEGEEETCNWPWALRVPLSLEIRVYDSNARIGVRSGPARPQSVQWLRQASGLGNGEEPGISPSRSTYPGSSEVGEETKESTKV